MTGLEGNTLATVLERFCRESPTVVWLEFDRQEVVRQANPTVTTLLGYDPVGRRAGDIFVDFRQELSLATMAAMAGHADGPGILTLNTGQGHPESLLVVVHDLGDRFLLLGQPDYQEITRIRREMLQLTNETSNLARELAKKNAELNQLNETKSHFIGMAAHDLRNPIGIIRSYSEFLLDNANQKQEAENVDFLSEILTTCDFMLHLLNDLLDITKIEAGKIRLKLQPIDLVDLIAHNLVLNRRLAEKKGIHLVFTHPEPIPSVPADPVRIEQVLNNLVSNAIKFSQGGTTVTITVFRSDTFVTVSIRDQGPGIPEDERSRLFQPFYRASIQPTGGESSTGLGLAIARKLVQEHLGQMHVESEMGQGSTFYFSLPLDGPGKGVDGSAR